MTGHTANWKEKEVQEIFSLAEQYPVIAIADLNMFPANLFQKLRKQLKGDAVVRVSKSKIIAKALEKSKFRETGLTDYSKGIIAVIFTTMNPFELAGFLKKNKGNAPAKAGQVAPLDIIVPAMDTGLPPGPALSDLKGAGLKVKVEGATIAIVKDCVVAKEGDIISAAVAGTLSKLDIKPMRIGLNLKAVVEGTELYLPDVLDIDADQVFADFQKAAQETFNLACEMAYLTDQTVPVLLSKAAGEAFNLAVEAKIYTKESLELFVSKANSEASVLKEQVKDVPAKEEPKAEKPAEKTEEKSEEKAEEAQKEEPAKEPPKIAEPVENKPEEKKEENN